MPKYAAQQTSALRLITAKGQAMTLYRVTLATYDPLNPSASVPTIAQSASGFGIVLPPTTQTLAAYESVIKADPQARQAFRSILLAAKGFFTPQPQDILKTAEGNVRIIGVDSLNPAGDGAIIYTLGCTLDLQLVIP